MPNSTHALAIYDVSEPANPTARYVSSGGYLMSLTLSGRHLYVPSQAFEGNRTGLLVFDVSNPTNPVFQASAKASIRVGASVGVQGDYAYLANGVNGLDVFDVSGLASANLPKVGHADSIGTHLAVRDHFVYMANSQDGLRIYAITPRLTIDRTTANSLLLSWPATASFRLQQNPNLNFSNWATLTNTPISAGARDQIALLPQPGNSFFRLVSN
jgi:hypothetical protein